jgi:hypothetical protein
VREVFTENQPSRLQVVAYRIVNGTLVRRESQGVRDLVQLDGCGSRGQRHRHQRRRRAAGRVTPGCRSRPG